MADLVAADVTVNLATLNTVAGNDSNRGYDIQIFGRRKEAHVAIAFGDGAKTYPAGGVPMPGFASFFLTRNIDDVILTDEGVGTALAIKYDKAAKTIRLYNAGAELTASVDAPAAMTVYAYVTGW